MLPEIRYLKTGNTLSTAKVREFLRTTENFFALLDRDKLVSVVQIEAAWEHVLRNRGGKVRDDPTLLMLYLSGTSQISRAYETVGINSETRNVVAVYENPRDLENFLEMFSGLLVDDQSHRLPRDCPEKDSLVFGKIAKVELEIS